MISPSEELARLKRMDALEEMPLPPISDEIWKMIIDRSSIPAILNRILRGFVWVSKPDGKGEWQQLGEEMVNKKGIKFILTVLISSMSVDKIATMLNDSEVREMAGRMRDNVIDVLTVRGEEFAINPSNMTFIVDLVDMFFFANLTAARGGVILKALKPSYERKEVVATTQKKGILSKLPGVG